MVHAVGGPGTPFFKFGKFMNRRKTAAMWLRCAARTLQVQRAVEGKIQSELCKCP